MRLDERLLVADAAGRGWRSGPPSFG
jgi:hypothetical protein